MSVSSPLGAIGVDLSEWQDGVDYAALRAAGVTFAILKVGHYFGRVDPNLATHRDGCREAGIAVGYYWFAYGTLNPEAEARNFVEWSGRREGEPMFLDAEHDSLNQEWCDRFLATVDELTGTPCGFYSYWSWMRQRPWTAQTATGRPLWLAVYNAGNTVPTWVQRASLPGLKVAGHQFSSTFRLDGYPGPLDANIWYGGLAAFRAAGGAVETATAATPPVPPPAPQKPTPGPLVVDGKIGPKTVALLQRLLGGLVDDGNISGQAASDLRVWPTWSTMCAGIGGSATGRKLQRLLNRRVAWRGVLSVPLVEDGLLGPKTCRVLQHWLNVTPDGLFGDISARALQRNLNAIVTAGKDIRA